MSGDGFPCVSHFFVSCLGLLSFWICEFMVFDKFGRFFSHCFLRYFFYTLLLISFWDFHVIHIKLFGIELQVPETLRFLLSLSSLYSSDWITITDLFQVYWLFLLSSPFCYWAHSMLSPWWMCFSVLNFFLLLLFIF